MSKLPPAPSESDYLQLERYLMSVFQLLEGIADIDTAALGMRELLGSPEARDLEPSLEVLLYELFFAKCRKYYLKSAE